VPDGGGTRTVSRSAWLELKEEQKLVVDGYEFLDEKAMLIAAEMLAQRKLYVESRRHFLALCNAAADALISTVGELGLEGLQVYPAAKIEGRVIETGERACIGQTLVEASFVANLTGPTEVPAMRSANAQRSAMAFLGALEAGASLAALATNLERLAREYRRTWRRVRALENVVLPEIDADLAAMEEHLDLIEQEEIIRVRTAGVERH
jgi:V/A-type H+-transporting ATPase subunit D